jgi:putative isomerase
LRFNLEMMSENRFGIAVADREDIAIERAHRCAAAADVAVPLPEQAGAHVGALDAVRDVMGWNTVWDEISRRPYTSISRNWDLAKFGGYGVWLNDQQYAALMTDMLDPEMGRENLATVLAGATPEGNLACLLAANDAWVDRNQPPIGSFLVWLMYLRSRSRPLLELAYDTLSRNHAWWWRCRDPLGRGLVSLGTSDVGEGLYRGTAFGARNESAMDNAPIHDEAPYDPETRTLAAADVGLNSLLALDAEILALIANELGRDETTAYAATAERLRARIRDELWDEERRIFANRLRSGPFVRSVGPTSFYPMLAGAATPEQVTALLAHLNDPAKFGGEPGLPGVSRDDPAYKDNRYWRGRIWPTFNYLVWQGLRRCGEHAAANALANRSFALFRRSWEASRLCPENYNAETGEPLDQPDTERFYSWGALMAVLGVNRIMDIGPWLGWELTNDGAAARLGPIASPVGQVTVAIEDGVLTLAKGKQRMLVSNVRGSISQLHFGERAISLVMPAKVEKGTFLHFPSVSPDSLPSVLVDGKPVGHAELDAGIIVKDLPSASRPSEVELFCRAGRR